MKRKLQVLKELAHRNAQRVAYVAAGSTVMAGNAMAAVPEAVTTAMADMKADAIVVASAFLVAIIAIAAFKLMRRGA